MPFVAFFFLPIRQTRNERVAHGFPRLEYVLAAAAWVASPKFGQNPHLEMLTTTLAEPVPVAQINHMLDAGPAGTADQPPQRAVAAHLSL